MNRRNRMPAPGKSRHPLFVIIGLSWAMSCSAGTIAFAADQPTSRPPWTTSRMQGSPEAPEPYRLTPAFPRIRFENPTSIEEIPGADRLLVTERAGNILSFRKAAAASETDLVLDLRSLLPSQLADQSVSLLDAELHPNFRDNRHLFVCYVHPGNGGHSRVSRFILTADPVPRAVPGSEQVIITWPAGGHNAGCLEFGTDGCLYVATGDGSGPNPPDGLTTGQDVSDLLGAILRIDVDHHMSDQAYSVPADNPFVEVSGARPEIWAYGLRNPFKFGVDPHTGDIFAADNGWESWEMVHRIVRGGNCGWPVMEGRVALRTEVKLGPTPIIPPVKDHPHTEANSVIGGPVYRGVKLADLGGSFVYGDYITGTIWAIRPDKDGAYSHRTLVDTDQRIVAFCEGSRGELFVLDYDFTGHVYELLPSGLRDNSANFPRRLSETGLFASVENMAPAPGVVPYEVQVERWMDGAQADRWVAIPGAGLIELASGNAPATFPEGTVLVKHLTLPQASGNAIRLETQLLHYESGVWRPYSYLWDEAGRDAQLVASIGASRPLQVADATAQGGVLERTWRVNATNECKLCHNAGPRFVLGFVPNQLNRPVDSSDPGSPNQLRLLAAQGVIAAAPQIADDDPPRLVDPHDSSHALEDRARSYLHANCSMCHHPGGNAIISFYLRRDLPFDKLNTNKGTGIGTFGIRDARIISPGDPYRSLLLYRMAKLGYARMPYIGSQVVDSDGVALVERWIRSLPTDNPATISPPAAGDSDDARAFERLTSGAKSVSQEQRDDAIRTLLKSTEGALALAAGLHQGSAPGDDLRSAVSSGVASPTSDVRGLFDTFLPESQRRATLGASIDPQVILGRQGDQQRGKLIFFSDGARCRACHEIDEPGNSLGPTLQEINKKFSRPAELLQHVLQPSLKIDDPFAAYAVVTNDGRAINGLLVQQDTREIVIKTADKKLVSIGRDNIAEMHKSPKSLMPELILSDLTSQEAADLFQYIQSLGVPK
ncbi:MAG: PQQ-dependent sugar dehydrogenase [Planctomycetes bacterium]|nr:PQQ-dependent sugar dehydrogenase [Planctomycetota bacterium]